MDNYKQIMLYLDSRKASTNDIGDFKFKFSETIKADYIELIDYQLPWSFANVDWSNNDIVFNLFPENTTILLYIPPGYYDSKRFIDTLNVLMNPKKLDKKTSVYPYLMEISLSEENKLKFTMYSDNHILKFDYAKSTASSLLGLTENMTIDCTQKYDSDYLLDSPIQCIIIDDLNHDLSFKISNINGEDLIINSIIPNGAYTTDSLKVALFNILNVYEFGRPKYDYIMTLYYVFDSHRFKFRMQYILSQHNMTLLASSSFVSNVFEQSIDFVIPGTTSSAGFGDVFLDKIFNTLTITSLNKHIAFFVEGNNTGGGRVESFDLPEGMMEVAPFIQYLYTHFNIAVAGVKVYQDLDITPSLSSLGHINICVKGYYNIKLLYADSTAHSILGFSQDVDMDNMKRAQNLTFTLPINLLNIDHLEIRLPQTIHNIEASEDGKFMDQSECDLCEIVKLSTFQMGAMISPTNQTGMIHAINNHRKMMSDLIVRITDQKGFTPTQYYYTKDFSFLLTFRLYYLQR
jgi:hypothetical protein